MSFFDLGIAATDPEQSPIQCRKGDRFSVKADGHSGDVIPGDRPLSTRPYQAGLSQNRIGKYLRNWRQLFLLHHLTPILVSLHQQTITGVLLPFPHPAGVAGGFLLGHGW